MEITKTDIYSIDNAAKKSGACIILVGHVDVKIGEHVVCNNNFGMGATYEEALTNLKKRCSRTNDMSDVVAIEITNVDIDGKPFMCHGC